MKNDMVTIEVPELEEYPKITELMSRALGVEITADKFLELMVSLNYHKYNILKMTQTPEQVAEMAKYMLDKNAQDRPVDWPKIVADK